MRTFAAAAVIAASASAFDVMAVPDFVAGFMYALTGDNNLTEIEACFQGGEQIVTDAQTAIADFEAGNYFKGIKDAGTAWNEVGSAMTTCQGMDDDIAAIEAWAQIFTEPATLSKTVAKHWLFHGDEIKADLAKEQADWSAGNYFDAGKDTADALVLAVGPVPTASANMPLDAPILFLGGVLEGLVQDNHLTAIATCATDAEGVVDEVEGLVSAIEKGNWFFAAEKARKVIKDVPLALTDCKAMGSDLTALEQWAAIFTDPSALVADVTKHFLLHRKEIEADIGTVKTDWAAAEYFNAGKATADLLTVAVGPVQTPDNLDFSLLALPELAAGFVYGMVGDNHLTEMEACYQGTSPLFTYLETALTDLEHFQIFKAMSQFELFVYHFQMDVAPCTQMTDDIAEIESWAAAFKNPTSLISEVTKHYLLHKKAVSADIAAIKADWATGAYFATGKDAADLLTVLIPMQ